MNYSDFNNIFQFKPFDQINNASKKLLEENLHIENTDRLSGKD